MKARYALNYAGPRDRTPWRMPDWCFYAIVFLPLIGGIGAAIIVPKCFGRRESWGPSAASEVAMLHGAVEQFEVDYGRYPTTGEGLSILANPTEPGGHIYISRLPKDTWGRPYVYRFPSKRAGVNFDLFSLGEDGIEGTSDDIP